MKTKGIDSHKVNKVVSQILIKRMIISKEKNRNYKNKNKNVSNRMIL